MDEKMIIIPFDYSDSDKSLSYIEVLESIKKDEKLIITHCLEFFSFFYLDKGYDVKVIKRNGDYILLSELLTDTENTYTQKQIRKAHNVKRLLTSNSLTFKKGKSIG
jgi:hypothetical protein